MSDKRKIAVSTIEMAAIVAALNEYGVAPLGASLHDRFVAADPANDGPETEILADVYLKFARRLQAIYPNEPISRHAAKMRMLGEGYGNGQ